MIASAAWGTLSLLFLLAAVGASMSRPHPMHERWLDAMLEEMEADDDG
jgi:hypothetical protein